MTGATSGYLRFSKVPELMVYQKPEAVDLTKSIIHNEHSQINLLRVYCVIYTTALSALRTNEEELD